MSDIPQIIGGVSLLVGTVFTGWAAVDNRRRKNDAEALEELSARQRWSPRVLRAVTVLRETLARFGVAEPDGIDDLISYPPPKPKHSREDDDD